MYSDSELLRDRMQFKKVYVGEPISDSLSRIDNVFRQPLLVAEEVTICKIGLMEMSCDVGQPHDEAAAAARVLASQLWSHIE